MLVKILNPSINRSIVKSSDANDESCQLRRDLGRGTEKLSLDFDQFKNNHAINDLGIQERQYVYK